MPTYRANRGNLLQHWVLAEVVSLVRTAVPTNVRANRNMMSMVFTRGVQQIRDAKLQQRFDAWLRQATAPKQTPAGAVGTKKLNGPLLNARPSSVMESSMTEFRSGNTKTTQIGYINRNQQESAVIANVQAVIAGRKKCSHVYGANGTDVFQRRCPRCGNGAPGIPF